MTQITEEYWTKRDGTRIAVGDMDIDHLRNALRMIIRNHRRRTQAAARCLLDDTFDWEVESDRQAHHNMSVLIFFDE
jgi:hypothetical protein